jgi:hypothetical protein
MTILKFSQARQHHQQQSEVNIFIQLSIIRTDDHNLSAWLTERYETVIFNYFLGQVSYSVIFKTAERIWNVPHKSFSYPAAYTILLAENTICVNLLETLQNDRNKNVIVISLPVAHMTRPIAN